MRKLIAVTSEQVLMSCLSLESFKEKLEQDFWREIYMSGGMLD